MNLVKLSVICILFISSFAFGFDGPAKEVSRDLDKKVHAYLDEDSEDSPRKLASEGKENVIPHWKYEEEDSEEDEALEE